MESQLYLYVIELENNQLLLHPSSEKKEELIYIECQILYELVKSNPIKIVIEMIPIDDYLEIDKSVKKYMLFYGIDNVRGGTYCDETLPDFLVKTLKSEFNTYEKLVSNRHLLYDTLFDKYGDSTKEVVLQEMESLQKQINDFTQTKQKYNEYKFFHTPEVSRESLGRKIFYDISWLFDFVAYREFSNEKIKPETNEIYCELLAKLKFITKTFFKITENVDYEPVCYLHNPEFVLDTFFYHSTQDYGALYADFAKLMKTFRYMCYKIINRLDEYEFDLTFFPPHFEEESEIAKKYLHLLIDQFAVQTSF